ncbi:TPA: catalase [Pseudomonas aeruginosa]|nr:catalase [Pseudomonas aeruginosa]
MHTRSCLPLALAALLLSQAGELRAGEETRIDRLAKELVETLYQGAGEHPGYRVNHAKGLLLSGRFLPSTEAHELGPVWLRQAATRLWIRLSNFSGIPTIPDNTPQASPRGIALRFLLPDGKQGDIVGHSVNGFPARTPAEFLDFLQVANRAAAEPSVLQNYLAAHAAAQHFFAEPLRVPQSFARTAFYPLHALYVDDGRGGRLLGRLLIKPELGVATLEEAQLPGLPADFLQQELRARLASGPVRYHLLLQLATAGDDPADISRPWTGRRLLRLGTIEVDEVAPNQDLQRQLAFDPTQLLPGVEPAGDPMFAARRSAYAISVERRQRSPTGPR